MEISTPQYGLPGSSRPSSQYTVALGLLSEVIAASNASIAAEQSRSRTDPNVLEGLLAERSAAIRALSRLHHDDPEGLRRTISEYHDLADLTPIRLARPGVASRGGRSRRA